MTHIDFARQDYALALRDAADIAPTLRKFGMTLTQSDVIALTDRRYQALSDTGRVEFGPGVLRELALAFCDSPSIGAADFADTLGEMQDLFYDFKNLSDNLLTDEELIALMKAHFDGPCEGSLEYMADTTLSDLLSEMRGEREDN